MSKWMLSIWTEHLFDIIKGASLLMKTIGIFNLKGGSAKTTSVWALGSVISQYMEKRILLIDIDPSANLSAFFRQAIHQGEQFDHTIRDLIENEDDPSSYIRSFTFCRTPGTRKDRDNYFTIQGHPSEQDLLDENGKAPTRSCRLDLIPGDKTIGTLNVSDYDVLRKIIDKIEDLNEYDYVLLDFPPEYMLISIIGLMACDMILIPSEAASDSVEGVESILNIVDEIEDAGHELQILGIFFTKVAASESVPKAIIQIMKEMTEGTDLLLESRIARTSTAEKCRSIGTVCGVLDMLNGMTKEYLELALEIKERIGG